MQKIIACDLGNTNLKAALMAKDYGGWRVEDFWRHTPEDAVPVLAAQARLTQASVVLMTVRTDETAGELVKGFTDFGVPVTLLEMAHASQVPMNVDRSTVGLDRICNVLAAASHTDDGYGAIVVDVGTAVTVDVLSPDGRFLGGAIAPSPQVAMYGLFHKAPRLSAFTPKMPEGPAVPVTTAAALGVGQFIGGAGAISRIIRYMVESLDFKAHVIGTGGGMVSLLDLVPEIETYVPHLTLEGIAVLAESANLLK